MIGSKLRHDDFDWFNSQMSTFDVFFEQRIDNNSKIYKWITRLTIEDLLRSDSEVQPQREESGHGLVNILATKLQRHPIMLDDKLDQIAKSGKEKNGQYCWSFLLHHEESYWFTLILILSCAIFLSFIFRSCWPKYLLSINSCKNL